MYKTFLLFNDGNTQITVVKVQLHDVLKKQQRTLVLRTHSEVEVRVGIKDIN